LEDGRAFRVPEEPARVCINLDRGNAELRQEMSAPADAPLTTFPEIFMRGPERGVQHRVTAMDVNRLTGKRIEVLEA